MPLNSIELWIQKGAGCTIYRAAVKGNLYFTVQIFERSAFFGKPCAIEEFMWDVWVKNCWFNVSLEQQKKFAEITKSSTFDNLAPRWQKNFRTEWRILDVSSTIPNKDAVCIHKKNSPHISVHNHSRNFLIFFPSEPAQTNAAFEVTRIFLLNCGARWNIIRYPEGLAVNLLLPVLSKLSNFSNY